MKTPLIVKSLALVSILNNLPKFKNFNISNKKVYFSSPQEPFVGLPLIKRQFLFEGSLRGLCHMQKSLDKISIEARL